jgi:hypothetical protein
MQSMSRFYQAILLLYPADFRHEFGCEMAMIFEEQLEDAFRRGFSEVTLVWWCAVRETLTLALPMRASDPAVIAPAVSWVATSAVMLPLMWALNNPLALNAWARQAFGTGCRW